jgi:hypothetical protein
MKFSRTEYGLSLCAVVLIVLLVAVLSGVPWGLRGRPEREVPKGASVKLAGEQGSIRPAGPRKRTVPMSTAISAAGPVNEEAEVKAVVFAEGMPIAGAGAGASLIRKDPQGRRRIEFRAGPESSDAGGSVVLKVVVPVQEGEEGDVWALCAYHPEYGTGYKEVSLSELRSGGLLELDLEKGQIVVGRIVGKDGLGAVGVDVGVGTTWKAGGVSLFGQGQTGAFGSQACVLITGRSPSL